MAFVDLTIFLFISILVPPSSTIKCYRCKGIECIQLILPLETCPDIAEGWVSLLLENLETRSMYEMIRDCFHFEYNYYCNSKRLASGMCEFCDHADGCNLEEKEPLVCRQCDAIEGPDGFSCDHQTLCQPLFRTVKPQCYISWFPTIGTMYGCLHTAPRFLRINQKNFDPLNFQSVLCDYNDCNDRIEKLFDNHTGLLEPQRYCYVGKKPKLFSIINCRNPVEQGSKVIFCLYSTMPANRYIMDCMNDYYTQEEDLE